MAGEPLDAVRRGLQIIVSAVRSEPQALEMVYLSIITFDSSAQQVVPLTNLAVFEVPLLKTVSTAKHLGEALTLFCNKIDSEVNKGSAEIKGDWKPLFFIMMDGNPTDNWQQGADEIIKRKLTVIACAAGFDADTNILKQITDNVVHLNSAGFADIRAFFKWGDFSIVVDKKCNCDKCGKIHSRYSSKCENCGARLCEECAPSWNSINLKHERICPLCGFYEKLELPPPPEEINLII